MPPPGMPKHGTGYAGSFFSFDLATVQSFVHFLLDNMFVAFGEILLQHWYPNGHQLCFLAGKFLLGNV